MAKRNKKTPKGKLDKLTGAWERRFDLGQEPVDAGQPYVDILKFTGRGPRTRKSVTIFATIFDNPDGITGKTYTGSYKGSEWTYKDDFVAIYTDTNNSGRLEASDKFLGSFDTGGDFGGLQGTMSSGTFYLDKKNILSQYDQLGNLFSQIKLPISIV